MHRFKLVLASFALTIMLLPALLTGTASAQTLHSRSAHQKAVAASCSYSERSNVPIWSDDGRTYLGYTIIWEGVCGTQVYAHEQTISRVGVVDITSAIGVNIRNEFTEQDSNNVTSNNTGSIVFYPSHTGGEGCITELFLGFPDGPSGCGDTFA